MALSRRLRFEILRRDNHTCRYCGGTAPDVALTVDHVIPITLGGGDEANNLVAACKDCNAGKSSVQPGAPLVEEVDAAALLFAQAVETAAERRRADFKALDLAVGIFDDIWTDWKTNNGEGETVPRDANWRASVERFFSLGLNDEDFERLVRIAMTAKVALTETWRYFCGCCWRELTDRQELARTLLEDGKA